MKEQEIAAGFMRYQTAEDLQLIVDFIESRADDVDGLPPVRPAETLRQLLRELIEANLL